MLGGHQADVAEQGARRASWDDRRVLNGICRIAMAHAPPATTVSSGGEGPECGGGSWTHLPPLMMRPSK